MFNNWLKETSKLSDSSVYKYTHAVNTISREMMERKVISKPIKDMELFEIDLAIYLQDLYYRLGQLIDVKSEELESFLTHSVVGNKKKIALKDIGIVDDFAIEELSTKSHLFNDDIPNMERIIEYGKMLPDETPLKYSIKDVFGF